MDLENTFIDELISRREEARQKQNWSLSDEIRDYLDSKHVFVFDTHNQQVVYHRKNGTRQDLIEKIKKEQRSNKLFDAWLYSMKLNVKPKTS